MRFAFAVLFWACLSAPAFALMPAALARQHDRPVRPAANSHSGGAAHRTLRRARDAGQSSP